MPPAAITLLLLVASFKYDRSGAFAENKQKKNTECRKRVDKKFTRFAASCKGNFSRINENIKKLKAICVSAC